MIKVMFSLRNANVCVFFLKKRQSFFWQRTGLFISFNFEISVSCKKLQHYNAKINRILFPRQYRSTQFELWQKYGSTLELF